MIDLFAEEDLICLSRKEAVVVEAVVVEAVFLVVVVEVLVV
jgi:hypothetical protein